MVCSPATSAPAEKRGTAGDDVIGDRKPRDLRQQLVDYDVIYAARRPIRLLPVDEKRFVGRRWGEYEPDFSDNDKRSIRPMWMFAVNRQKLRIVESFAVAYVYWNATVPVIETVGISLRLQLDNRPSITL